jgi:peptide deformylase
MGARVARIRRYGNRCLRRRAWSVDPADEGTRELLDTLWATLRADGGVGLAAPQINRDCRVVVVIDPERTPGKQRIDLVNPVILETFGPRVSFEEGCLSFPGLYTHVWRPQGVVVEFDGPVGRQTLRDEGLVSRIILHEIDHLDGILFIDHLPVWKKLMLPPRLLMFVMSEVWRKISGKVRDDR